ncbi:MAG: cyclic nucleotide-binding domain-containing protein [Vicinamibacteria bacterium]
MLSWLSGGQSVQQLIAAKKWDKAAAQLQAEIKSAPRDSRTRMQLADVLIEAGRGKDAVPILLKLAQEFGTEGSAPRAIAVLKKVERIQPGRSDVQKALAALIKKSAPKVAVSSGIGEIIRGTDQFEMEEIGLDLRPSMEPSEFMFQAPASLAVPPPSTPAATRPAPPPPKAVLKEEENVEMEMEDLVMPPPMSLFEIAAMPAPMAPPPVFVMLQAAAPLPAPAPQPAAAPPSEPARVVPMTEAASMLANMTGADRGLFDDLLDTIQQVLDDAPPPSADAPAAPRFSSPLFADFDEGDLVAVIQGLELASYESGDILILEGDPGTSLFVITSGTVRAYVRQPDGKNKMVREMGEGSFFGEISVLSGKPRTATVTAKTPVEALVLERKTLDEICKTHPSVRTTLQKFAAERLKANTK